MMSGKDFWNSVSLNVNEKQKHILNSMTELSEVRSSSQRLQRPERIVDVARVSSQCKFLSSRLAVRSQETY